MHLADKVYFYSSYGASEASDMQFISGQWTDAR